eukprot:TRINITY_DN109608_c0_g1_i1.p1 TRINITY_DN109608_c0_g1~~TRINITY_DN109608_c0_g1_i1.p1  ORF type:complete len:562 (+),score=54.16 TRINITY_DN109608_c0_g1_i1:40-1686(+)
MAQTPHGNSCPRNWLVRASLLVCSLLVILVATGTGIAAACHGKWWPIVFLPVLCVAAMILLVTLLVLAMLAMAVSKVFPWAWAREGSLKHIPFDESVRVSRIHWLLDTLPPTLYIDDYTVMTEVSDLREMREGDHCIVGVNVFHNLSPRVDAIVSRLTSLELLPLRVYHHFVLVDSVDRLTAEGLPLRADGKPVRIAEFSETFPGGLRRITVNGYRPVDLWRGLQELLASPARYHTPPLSTYLPAQRRKGCRGNGIFRLHQELSEEQRRRTCRAALALASSPAGQDAPSLPSYGLLTANCEHVSFSLSAQSQRWISPQVSHMVWCTFRLLLQVGSLFWLVGLSWVGTFTDEPHLHAVLAALYHLLSTVPVLLQTQVHLVRSAVNLTQRRLELGQVTYNYLIIKESVRTVVVGGISVATLALMPRMVWDTNCVGLASFISLTIYPASSILFNLSLQVLVRTSQRAGVGVPVVLFDDLRSSSTDSICDTDVPDTDLFDADSPGNVDGFRSDLDAEDLFADSAKISHTTAERLVGMSATPRKRATRECRGD